MFAELTAAASAVKQVTELLALIHKTKVSEAVSVKAIELQGVILSLQESCATLRSGYEEVKSERDALAQKIVEIENWKAEAAKYELLHPAPGVVVYAPKPQVENGEPFHWLCANCYSHRHKSFLQRTGIAGNDVTYRCFTCSLEFTARALHDLERPASTSG